MSCKWFKGFEFLYISKDFVKEYFLFVNFYEDKEICINVNKLVLKIVDFINCFERFFIWNFLIFVVIVLKIVVRKWKYMIFDFLIIK